MLRLAVLSFILLFCSSTFSQAKFWLLDEYFDKHPKQKILSESFTNIVRNPPKPLSKTQTTPILVYFITPSRQLSDYWRRSQIAFTKRINELGIKYILKHYEMTANNMPKQRNKLLQRALLERPDFLILTLDAVTDISIIESILEQTETRIIFQNVTNPLKNLKKKQPLLYIGFDHVSGTKMLADYFIKPFPEEENLPLITFIEVI